MVFTTSQITIIALFAIFLSFISLLFIFCIYSSRQARRDTSNAQKAVLGTWKENGLPHNFSVPSLHSTIRQEFDLNTLPHNNIKHQHQNHHHPMPLPHIQSKDGDGDGVSVRTEKRGSGLAGIGTFSATSNKAKSTSTPAPAPALTDTSFPSSSAQHPISNIQSRPGEQPTITPTPTFSRPLSWSKGLPTTLHLTRKRSQSHASEKSKSSFKFTNMATRHRTGTGMKVADRTPQLPPIPRKNSARSLASQNSRSLSTGKMVEKGNVAPVIGRTGRRA
ncbi:uncharacterized protein I303_105559 [Kwoniella dejecticola CBS 10117]|uniref:Uncharacterized protein n=1 Tax=Kwoniella dejecticola CBS 10117 TaxID=1296121 RepID=A0A1A6A250_9TREE|nr:uncharacterized protein I303_04998 [Kwoniella dejecticola CBS 10117]OBR84141.1 hypothetical protein I303_04998 [Kwoniella dejecticola CBS 10117]